MLFRNYFQKLNTIGATSADAVGTYGRSLGVVVRNGELEDIDNNEGCDVGLRVMVGKRQSCVSTSDTSHAASIEKMAERAVAMAKLAPERSLLWTSRNYQTQKA